MQVVNSDLWWMAGVSLVHPGPPSIWVQNGPATAATGPTDPAVVGTSTLAAPHAAGNDS